MSKNKCLTWWFIYWFSGLDNKKKVTINPKNGGDRCFQYAATIASAFDEIKKDTQRVFNMKPFINNNWERINYPSKFEDWKRFKK